MFRVMLWSQWKWSRLVTVLGALAAFSIPILSAQGASAPNRHPMEPEQLLRTVQTWGTLYPVLAAGLGLLIAIACWGPDHRGRHVHALSLPIARWRYVLLKYAAGLTLLALPVLALLAGALLATWTATLPSGLHAYPIALVIRFTLAVLVAFSVFFAIAGATPRTAGFILGFAALLVVVQILASAAGFGFNLLLYFQVVAVDWPGPLAIFTGHWLLIDV
ncbi:MAG: hypothetical protein ACHQXA_00170 [Gemmatimonadales bacterium]|jgi:hypothetical protein